MMKNKTDTLVCEQCEKEFDFKKCLGVFATDGTYYCDKCVKELIEVRDEQYEN